MAQLEVLDRSSTGRSAAEDRAQSVLLTAADLFYRQGFDATSMNDIAKAVNLTKAGLYYYTQGKDDLLYKIIQFAMDFVEQDIMAPAEQIADPEERLRFIIKAHVDSIIVTGGAITILTEEVGKLSPPQRQEIVLRKRRYLDVARGALQELRKQGRLRKLDVTVAALNMFSTIVGLARWYDPEGRHTSARITQETTHYIMAGLLRD